MARTRIRCPSCNAPFELPTISRDTQGRCPRCRARLVLRSAGKVTTVHLAPPSKAAAAEPVPMAEPLPIPEAEEVTFAEVRPARKKRPAIPTVLLICLVLGGISLVTIGGIALVVLVWGRISAELPPFAALRDQTISGLNRERRENSARYRAVYHRCWVEIRGRVGRVRRSPLDRTDHLEVLDLESRFVHAEADCYFRDPHSLEALNKDQVIRIVGRVDCDVTGTVTLYNCRIAEDD
jgi:hypothetical protein